MLRKDLRDVTEMAFSESLRIEELRPDDLPALFEFNRQALRLEGQRPRGERRERRATAATPATCGDELVGYYWWVDRSIEPRHRDIEHYGLEIELDDRAVYGFDFFLLEEHRGGGNSVEFLHKVETRLRDLGYETLWGYVVADNRPARWLYSMRGYRPVRKVAARRVLTRRVPIAGESELLEARTAGAERAGDPGLMRPSAAGFPNRPGCRYGVAR